MADGSGDAPQLDESIGLTLADPAEIERLVTVMVLIREEARALRAVIATLEADRILAVQTLTAISEAKLGVVSAQALRTLDVLNAEPMSL